MKKIVIVLTLLLLYNNFYAQDGKILERKRIDPLSNDQLAERILDKKTAGIRFAEKYSYLNEVIIEEITYSSDGNKVKGFLAYPKSKGKYPGIIYNRGGNLEFGSLNISKAVFILAKVASWGYIVVGSQYRQAS